MTDYDKYFRARLASCVERDRKYCEHMTHKAKQKEKRAMLLMASIVFCLLTLLFMF